MIFRIATTTGKLLITRDKNKVKLNAKVDWS